nr:glycosyltransferase family 8 protein [uncultured Rhodopila sp.]
MAECVHIFCAINDAYAMPLSVMLLSMERNMLQSAAVVAHVAYRRLSDRSIQMIERTVQDTSVSISWIPVDELPFSGAKIWGHVSLESYFRLCMGDFIPRKVCKVLYLDADLVFLGSVNELWATPLGRHTVLAAHDVSEFSGYVSSPMAVKNFRALGIPANQRYFNAGVMVVDLIKWRKDKVLDLCNRYMQRFSKDINYWDQDVLNAVLWNACGEIDYRWNVAAGAVIDYPNMASPPFDSLSFAKMIDEAKIYHFSTSEKPWHLNYDHPRRELFLSYFQETPWVHDAAFAHLLIDSQ